MIYNKVHVPLRQKFKGGTFGQYHTKHGMCLSDGPQILQKHAGVLCKNARDYEEGRKVDLRSKIATSNIL